MKRLHLFTSLALVLLCLGSGAWLPAGRMAAAQESFAAAGAPADGSVWYVDWEAAGTGDGSSWQDAFTGLQPALDAALAGDQIWVAAGTYTPSVEHGGSGDRFKSFAMKNQVGIYGGFDPSVGDVGWGDRDWLANVSTLSGNLGVPGDPADNSYHVFYHPSGRALDNTAVLDGFTVSGGNANRDYPRSGKDAEGGGMYNESSSPTLTNCTFSDNSARVYGGGMYNSGSTPTLTDCTFSGNTASLQGGGMYNNHSSPTLTNCTFSGNTAYWGGGMSNSGSTPTLTGCTFSGNTADWGGGMDNWDSSPTVTGCTFSDNSARVYGGGLSNVYSSPVVTDSTFSGNTAQDGGGGMFNFQSSSPMVTGCTFSGNTAAYGGGMANSSNPERTNRTFLSNPGDSGGGMGNALSSPVVTNCTFSGNTASEYGGGMSNGLSSPVVTNCTFSGNSAQHGGGGMYNGWSLPVVTNCILWGDSPGEVSGGSPTVTYSDVQGGYEGTGNLDADPLFADPGNADYHLGAGSPCIDAGTNDAPNLPEFDFEGDLRIVDGNGDGTAVADMGVDEYYVALSLHLSALKLAWKAGTQPGTYKVSARVRVHDQDHALAPDVTVFGDWTLPNGMIEHKTALTNASGQAKFSLKGKKAGSYEFCVTDMTKDGYVYDPAANETPACKAIVVGP